MVLTLFNYIKNLYKVYITEVFFEFNDPKELYFIKKVEDLNLRLFWARDSKDIMRSIYEIQGKETLTLELEELLSDLTLEILFRYTELRECYGYELSDKKVEEYSYLRHSIYSNIGLCSFLAEAI
jgi:hypothetical protein